MIQYALYNALLALASPPARLWLSRSRHAALLARFSPECPPGARGGLWVHACSVGEVNTIAPLIRLWRTRHPETPVLLTVSTETGMAQAARAYPELPVCWLPFDTAAGVRRFARALAPRALVLTETEIWPNLVRETRRMGLPVIVVNGRISPRQYPAYWRMRWFVRPVFAGLSAVGVQNSEYGERFMALGARPESVTVTGNLKFDAVTTEPDAMTRLQYRVECGYGPDDRVLLFGSTRPGDEELARHCLGHLRESMPDLRVIIAPRHPQRLAEAMAPFAGVPVTLRSDIKSGKTNKAGPVMFLDTMGELSNFYALATVAVIGGSFFPGVNGHNPLESAGLGVATVYGPFMGNFPEASAALLARNGAVQTSSGELPGVLGQLLGDARACRALGTLGRKALLENQGAAERNLLLIESLLTGG